MQVQVVLISSLGVALLGERGMVARKIIGGVIVIAAAVVISFP